MKKLLFLFSFLIVFLTGCGEKPDLDSYINNKYNFKFGYSGSVVFEEKEPQNSLLKLDVVKRNGAQAETAVLGGFFIWDKTLDKYLADWEGSKLAKSFERKDKKYNGQKFAIVSMTGEDSIQRILATEKNGKTFVLVLSRPKDDKDDISSLVAGVEEDYLDTFEFLK